MKTLFKTVVSAVVLSLSASVATAADFPTRNIRMIVPFGAGGGTDSVARALAKYAEPNLGQPIAIMNRTGGAGAVGMTTGANARPDGYTVTMITREIVTLPKLGLMQVDSDNFKMVRMVNFDPALITVKANSPFKSMTDVIAKAKAHPGSVKLASTAKPNFYALAIERNQNVNFNQIPFNGAAEAATAVMGGHVELTITGPGEVKAQIESGQLRPLAVMADKRLTSMPDVPTMKELGYDVISGTWRGIAAPKNTPDEIVAKLEDAFGKAVKDKNFVSFMNNGNFFVDDKNSAEFKTFIAEDTKSLMPLIEHL